MSVNTLGKTLVMCHLALSMLALTWSASVFLQFTDWGWKEPRKELDYRIPSEYDKRAADLKNSLRGRDMVYGPVRIAQATLRGAEERFPQNGLWYDSELRRLKFDMNPMIEVKEGVKFVGGAPELDTPGKATGKPVLENPLPNVQKSLAVYGEDLKKVHKEADGLTADTGTWILKTKDITYQLNGLDDKGKQVKTGLYDLLTIESKTQAAIKYELEYLQPHWVDALKEAEIYRVRRERLEDALKRTKPMK